VIYLLFLLLFVVSFLIVLNGFLRGSKTQTLDIFFGFFLTATIVSLFFLYGWKVGLISIVFAFASAIIQRPFAKSLALKLLNVEWAEKNLKPFFDFFEKEKK